MHIKISLPFDKMDLKIITDQILQFYIDLYIEYEATNTKMFCWLIGEKLYRAEQEISVHG